MVSTWNTKLGYSGSQLCIIPIKFTWRICALLIYVLQAGSDKVQHQAERRKFSDLLRTGQQVAFNHIWWKEARWFKRQEVPLFRRQLSCGSQIKMEVVASWQNLWYTDITMGLRSCLGLSILQGCTSCLQLGVQLCLVLFSGQRCCELTKGYQRQSKYRQYFLLCGLK